MHGAGQFLAYGVGLGTAEEAGQGVAVLRVGGGLAVTDEADERHGVFLSVLPVSAGAAGSRTAAVSEGVEAGFAHRPRP